VKNFNPDKCKIIKEHSRSEIFLSTAWHTTKPDLVFMAGSEGQVRLWDLASPKFEFKDLYKHESYITTLGISKETLVSGGYDGKLTFFDVNSNKVIRTIDAHSKWIRKLAISPDGKTVASVADDMVCRVWDLATGKQVRELRGHAEKTPTHFPSMLFALAFSNDGKLIATADKVGLINIWNLADGQAIQKLEAPGMYTWDPTARRHSIGGIRSVAFSGDGRFVAVGGTGKIGNIDHLEAKARVEVFDAQAGKKEFELASDKYAGLVNSLHFSADGKYLLGAGGANEGFYFFLDVPGKKFARQEKVNPHLHELVLHPTLPKAIAVGHHRFYLLEV
jgi:WD40 repeat protein